MGVPPSVVQASRVMRVIITIGADRYAADFTFSEGTGSITVPRGTADIVLSAVTGNNLIIAESVNENVTLVGGPNAVVMPAMSSQWVDPNLGVKVPYPQAWYVDTVRSPEADLRFRADFQHDIPSLKISVRNSVAGDSLARTLQLTIDAMRGVVTPLPVTFIDNIHSYDAGSARVAQAATVSLILEGAPREHYRIVAIDLADGKRLLLVAGAPEQMMTNDANLRAYVDNLPTAILFF
jgi:hypothetical protein